MENVKLFSMSNVNPYFQYLYECNVDVLKDMLECVRCHRFTRNDFSICSLTLSLSLSMSSVAPCVNNCPEKSISFSFVPCSAESTLLIVPVVLHHQRNICCKTWHKKPVTEVCISCHTLYWQFYHQWTGESWCVAPACCLHTVVPRIVCDSVTAVKYRLCCNCSRPSSTYLPFNPVFTLFDMIYLNVVPCHISWCDTLMLCWSQICQCHVGMCVRSVEQ